MLSALSQTRASFAEDPAASRGRHVFEPASRTRTPFARDRDRIIHATAFRRLKEKTQVFVAHEGDHYRTRLTHSLEVAQVARSLAHALRLDTDLAETIALAHDLGHPPFGHAGEDELQEQMVRWGGFDHNVQTFRVVTKLESRYPAFDGLNLSWETLEGLAKHNGPVAQPPWALEEADRALGLELSTWPSLEAQVAALADDIAYDNHDIDDGLRAGVLPLDALLEIPLVRRHWDAIGERHPELGIDRKLKALVRDQIGTMVGDLIAETRGRVGDSGVENLDDVRAAGGPLVGFSQQLAAEERELKRFLYANLYNAEPLQPIRVEAQRVVSNLAAAYLAEPRLLPDEWQAAADDQTVRARSVGDYIAGMTDPFAIRRHEELVGPAELPDRF